MKTATALLIALNLQFGALGFALFVFADAWRYAADRELEGIQIQLDYDREKSQNSLERLFRGSWKGGCL